MKVSRLIFVWLCLSQYAFSQNLKTAEGLKTGFWVEYYVWKGGIGTRSGSYQVISFDQLEIMDTVLDLAIYVIKQNGREKVIMAEEIEGNLLSVKDSIWRYFYPNGILESESLWDKGHILWCRSYDTKGCLAEFADYTTDTVYRYTYTDGRLYVKEIGIENRETKLYYPDDQLEIPYGNLYFRELIPTPGHLKVTESIDLRARKKLSIVSIKANSKRINCKLPSNQFPIQLKEDSSVKIDFELYSNPANITKSDSITIITSEPERKEYVIPCIIEVAHINNTFMVFAKPTDREKITLSKSKDKYLIVSDVETIVIKKGRKLVGFYYEVLNMTKIDVSKWTEGIYEIEVSRWTDTVQMVDLVIIK